MADLVKEYGKALYDLSAEEGLESEFLGEIRAIRTLLLDNPGFPILLSSPNIAKEERLSVLDRVFSGRVHTYLLSFFKLMTQRGYAKEILPCLDEYERLWYENSGIAVAEVLSAIPLSEEEKNRLHRKLEATSGKSVEMRCSVDPSLLGGVSVILDGVKLEGSIRSQLDRLHSSLLEKTF